MRTIKLHRPRLIVTWCLAHQVNLVMGDFIKKSPTAKSLIGNALEACAFLRGNDKARNGIEKRAKSPINFRVANVTRWNSVFLVIEHVLPYEAFIKAEAGEHGSRWIENAEPSRKDAITKIRNALESSAFWDGLRENYRRLYPLAVVQDALQSNQAKMHWVIPLWGWLAKYYAVHGPGYRPILDSLEMRWQRMDQSAFLLSYILAPQNMPWKGLSEEVRSKELKTTQIISMAEKMYQRVFEVESSRLPGEVALLIQGSGPFDPTFTKKFETQGDRCASLFWTVAAEEAPDLARLAIFLESLAINNAGLERTFSTMGWQYAPRRSRLGQDKVDKMAKICNSERGALHQTAPPKRRRLRRLDAVFRGENNEKIVERAEDCQTDDNLNEDESGDEEDILATAEGWQEYVSQYERSDEGKFDDDAGVTELKIPLQRLYMTHGPDETIERLLDRLMV